MADARFIDAAERLEDWLGYRHVIERIRFSTEDPEITFHFDNGIRVTLQFDDVHYNFSDRVTVSQFHNQFGSDIELKSDDLRVINFVYKILRGEAKPLILKCEEEIQDLWEEES